MDRVATTAVFLFFRMCSYFVTTGWIFRDRLMWEFNQSINNRTSSLSSTLFLQIIEVFEKKGDSPKKGIYLICFWPKTEDPYVHWSQYILYTSRRNPKKYPIVNGSEGPYISTQYEFRRSNFITRVVMLPLKSVSPERKDRKNTSNRCGPLVRIKQMLESSYIVVVTSRTVRLQPRLRGTEAYNSSMLPKKQQLDC